MQAKCKNISTQTEPKSHQILEYLSLVFSENEEERDNASERLKQAAHLAPDLFPEEVVDLICTLGNTNEFSKFTVPVCAELATGPNDFKDHLRQMALRNIEKGLHSELSAAVLDALGPDVLYPLSETCIERLLLSQDHHRPINGWEEGEPDYSHSTTTIVRSFDADPESVKKVIRRYLQNESDYVRYQLCGAIKLIQHERPGIATDMLQDLLKSLELYEQERLSSGTPSQQIVDILEAAFRYAPQEVDNFLAEVMARVRPTVQEDIIRAYRSLFFARSVNWTERDAHRRRIDITEIEMISINRLLIWAKDDKMEVDIRAAAVEALEMACEYASAGVLTHFDSLLGYFAIVSREKDPPTLPPKIFLLNEPQDPNLENLNESIRLQQWGIFKQRLQNCLEKLAEARPARVLDIVSDCMNQPLGHLEEGFKSCCTSLLGKLGKDYLLRPHVLPVIWRTIMDYTSARVRAASISAVKEMFRHSNALPPPNLIDTIIIHLRDPKIIVHQTALQVVSWNADWFDDSQSAEVLNILASHINAYRNDKFQIKEISEGILAVGQRHERLKIHALRIVESIFPTGEDLVDSDIAEKLLRYCDPNEKLAPFVAKDVGKYLGLYTRSWNDHVGYGKRIRMFEWLHKMPPPVYQQAEKDLLTSAKNIAKHDAWQSCLFASVFAQFRAFAYEHNILETAADSLPQEKRYDSFRASLRELASVAAVNSSLHGR